MRLFKRNKSEETPTEATADEQAAGPTEATAGVQAAEPTEVTADEQAAEPTEVTAGEPTEEPTDVLRDKGDADGQSVQQQVGEVAAGVEEPAPTAGRMRGRLFGRLGRSKGGLGAALSSVFSGKPDASVWESLEESLLMADVGVAATMELVKILNKRLGSASSPEDAREIVREELLSAIDGNGVERSLNLSAPGTTTKPQVVMVVGVNGTGKTTTTGKLARMLTADGYSVVLAAADTFRAAASEQLQTWGERVGVPVVRKEAGSDPASVAFDAYDYAVKNSADVLLVDTAGRLHTKQGLMDELGKVARVLGRHGEIAHTVLVLDATTGQNGLTQARVFSEVVPVSSVALTKLDGTAKGGIVIAVQRELSIPVSLVGLGEGVDDLAYFDPTAFVDALLS